MVSFLSFKYGIYIKVAKSEWNDWLDEIAREPLSCCFLSNNTWSTKCGIYFLSNDTDTDTKYKPKIKCRKSGIYPTHFHPMFHFCQNSGLMGHSRYVAGILPFIRSFTELPTIPKRPACQNAKQSWYFKIYQNFLSVDKGKQINCYCIQKYIGKQHI